MCIRDSIWTDRFTGNAWSGTVTVASVFGTFPVALLVADPEA